MCVLLYMFFFQKDKQFKHLAVRDVFTHRYRSPRKAAPMKKSTIQIYTRTEFRIIYCTLFCQRFVRDESRILELSGPCSGRSVKMKVSVARRNVTQCHVSHRDAPMGILQRSVRFYPFLYFVCVCVCVYCHWRIINA